MVGHHCHGLQRTDVDLSWRLLLEKKKVTQIPEILHLAGHLFHGLRANGLEAIVKLLLEKGVNLSST